MQVYAWTNFRKRINSTLQPDTANATEIDGYFRNSDPFSMYNPILRFNFGNTTPSYTYFYIPDFGNRYYYVIDWQHEEGIWIAKLREDVLASCKFDIGLTSEYILRSTANYDPNIIDTKYPTTSLVTTKNAYLSSVDVNIFDGTAMRSYTDQSMFNKTLTRGCFVVGIIGDNLQGVTYYAMGATQFKRLIHTIFDYTPDSIGELGTILAKEFVKPIQWIKSVYWFPYDYLSLWSGENSYDVRLGLLPVDLIIYGQILDPCFTFNCQASFDIERHPQFESHGAYTNTPAYTSYTLAFQPFGVFEIDPSLFVNTNRHQVSLSWKTDIATGDALLEINAGNSLIAQVRTSLGIPINLTEANVNIIGSVTGLLSGATSLMAPLASASSGVTKTITHKDVFSKDFKGMQSSEGMATEASERKDNSVVEKETTSTSETYRDPAAPVGGIVSAAAHAFPTPTTIGGSASYIAYAQNSPRLAMKFSQIVQNDRYAFGQPLCQFRVIGSIPGFVQTEGGHFRGPTLRETDEVNKFLVGGFYYE